MESKTFSICYLFTSSPHDVFHTQDHYLGAILGNNHASTSRLSIAQPNERKTIKPVDVGGIAGGEKYAISTVHRLMAVKPDSSSRGSSSSWPMISRSQMNHPVGCMEENRDLMSTQSRPLVMVRSHPGMPSCVLSTKSISSELKSTVQLQAAPVNGLNVPMVVHSRFVIVV